MQDNKRAKPNRKLILGFVIALLALIGSILATIFIRPEKTEVKNIEPVQASQEDSPSKDVDYDYTEMKQYIAQIEAHYAKFVAYIEKNYDAKATRIDLAGDLEAQTMLTEFIATIDALDGVIMANPNDDIKESWQEFQKSFSGRRADVVYGIDESKDNDWAQKLLVVYLIISSEAGAT